MIPKIIHYCWFGGNPMPELERKCIATWKQFCPDYQFMEWNESNFDVNFNDYVREAYENKKWAFVSDVARLYALVNYGGIYMDTDVELVKSLDGILEYSGVSGFGSMKAVETGLMAGEPGLPIYRELLEEYDSRRFVTEDGAMDLTANNHALTDKCMAHGLKRDGTLQTVYGLTVFPEDYFSPKNWTTRKLTMTENTVAIHHFDGLWLDDCTRYRLELRGKLGKKLPFMAAHRISKVIALLKFNGLRDGTALLLKRKT